MLVALASLVSAPAAVAQSDYPARPIELIVPWGPGGGADQLGRKIAQLWEPLLGKSLPVINVPGASGQTGLAKLLAAEANGYTISVITADTLSLSLSPKTRWKRGDVTVLGILTRQNSGFFIAKHGPFQSWQDFETAARAANQRVAITGFGTADDLLVKSLAAKGLKVISVPYADPGARYAAVIGGNADLLFEQAGDIRGFLQSGQLKPALFFSAEPEQEFPDVPLAASAGVTLQLPQYRAIVVKAGTKPEHVAKLRDTLAQAAAAPEFKDYLESQFAAHDSVVIGEEAERYIDHSLAEWKQSTGS